MMIGTYIYSVKSSDKNKFNFVEILFFGCL